MHTELMNQEVARLHRAETLRASRRYVAVEQEGNGHAEKARGLLVRMRGLARHGFRPVEVRASRAH